MYLPDVAARRTDCSTQFYSRFLSVRHACLTSSVFETACRVTINFVKKMRKNNKKDTKNEGDASPPKNEFKKAESEPETLPEQLELPMDQSTIVGSEPAVEGVYGTVDGEIWPPNSSSRSQTSRTLIEDFQKSTPKRDPGNTTSTETSRSRSAFTMPNQSQDVRERPEFKRNGWACVQKKAETWSKPKLNIRKWEEAQRPQKTINGPRRNPSDYQRSRSPVHKPVFKKPENKPESRPRSRKPDLARKVVVERKKPKEKKEKVETLAERWARLGGPKEKSESSAFFTQTPQDPAVIGGHSRSVGIRVQVRLDPGILDATIETGGYLREEFSAYLRVAGLEQRVENQELENSMLRGSADAFKEKLVEAKKEDKKKNLILKKANFDREVLKRKNEKLKKRKNEEKKKAAEIQRTDAHTGHTGHFFY